MYAYLLFSIKNPAYLPDIRSFIASASSLLPHGFSPEPVIVQPSEKFLLCYWAAPYASRVGDVNPGHYSSDDKGTFLCSNYAGPGLLGLTGGIKHISRVELGRLNFDKSPGGVASWAWIAPDANTAMAWSTTPPALATFVAKNRDGFCVAGNRPRLTYAASVLSKGYRPSLDYLAKYITAGFAVDGMTSFPNTIAIPPGLSALLVTGNFAFTDHPTPAIDPIPPSRPLHEKAEALAHLLRDACWPATASSASIFMSGGKDSRTIAATLYSLGVGRDTLAVNFGNTTTGEGELAQEVARAAEVPFEFRTQKLVSDPINALANALRQSEGLGTGFANQYQFDWQLGFAKGGPAFHGHGHLLRGGFARTMSRDKAYLHQAARGPFLSAYATATARQSTEAALDRYLRDVLPGLAREPRDILFYTNRDFRLGLFSTSNSLEMTAKTLMCYPLLDERVAQFAAALNVFDRVSERVVFGAVNAMAPQIADIPLFGEIWRLDRDPDKRDFVDSDHNFQDGYEKRRPRHVNKYEHPNAESALIQDADRVPSVVRLRETAQFVLDSRRWPEIRACVSPLIHADLAMRASGKEIDMSGAGYEDRFIRSAFLDRVAVAAAMYEIAW